MRYIKLTILILTIFLFTETSSNSQIVAPTGVLTRASSQMVFHYDLEDKDTAIQITNTNDTEGVWIHVQLFRSFDADDDTVNTINDKVICEERDFVDFLTPNDTHVYDLDEPSFAKNIGELQDTQGETTTIGGQLDDTFGFVVITPVVSKTDFSAISFQKLMGTSWNDSDADYILNAMGRDAVDFTTGEIVADGTVLDGITNGFVVLQPEEFLFNFVTDTDTDTDAIDIVGITFKDQYGPPGLLGYEVLAGETSWTSFIFDFKEDPTSCGSREIACFTSIGLNESLQQDNETLNPGPSDTTEDLLCAGTETPEYADGNSPNFVEPDFFGWTRVFISALEDMENHIGLYVNDDIQGAEFMFVRGERTEIIIEPPEEDCAIAGDEDGDGFSDCLDPDCDTDPSCENGDQCSDGEDNDDDGNTDCADAGCDGATGPNGETCETGVELTCDDGADNDGNTFADCDDPDCAVATNCIDEQVNDSGGGGCSVAEATSNSSSLLNFLLPMIAIGFGVRRLRRVN